MEATYSLSEVKSLLRSVDLSEINILRQVMLEDAGCYSPGEVEAMTKMIELRIKYLTRTSIQFDFEINLN